MTTTVIVGASIGGVRTAQCLRSEGYDGDIILLGDEHHEPYDRPPLSKAVLAGSAGADSTRLMTASEADAAGIRLLLGRRATDVRIDGNEVQLERHPPIQYDHLVVATGARARGGPWGNVPGLHVVRTLDDADRLRLDLLDGGHVVVIGGGFIGGEIASTARSVGCDVTLVARSPGPMGRALSPDVGDWFTNFYERNGVRCRFGVGVQNLSRDRARFTITLTDGSVLSARVVVLGLGADPNVEWLQSSGLAIDDGLLCDSFSRATGTSNVFAVGDVARWYHPRRAASVRAEHWTNAVEQAAVVAHNVVNPSDMREHTPVEYVWTDQHDWKIQLIGTTRTTQSTIVGDPVTNGSFAVLHSRDGISLCGATVVNWPRALMACRRALRGSALVAVVQEEIEQHLDGRAPVGAGQNGGSS